MSEQILLFDSGVLLLAANVAVASVVVGLAALSLQRCVSGRSLPLQHGMLTAAVAVLLLAPVCLVLSAGIPGIGIRWPADATETVEAAAGDPGELAESRAGDPFAALPVDAQSAAIPRTHGDGVALDLSGVAMVVEDVPPPEADGLSQASEAVVTDTVRETSPVSTERAAAPVMPVNPVESADFRRNDNPATAVTVWSHDRIGSMLLLIWSVGIAIGLSRCVYGFVLVARLRRRAAVVPSLKVGSLMTTVSEAVGLRHVPPVLHSGQVEVPLTLGLFRPAIVLPADLIDAPPETKLRAILLHEAAHIARRDLWVGVVERLASSLYWWNPLVHGINRRLNDVRESLCDNHVLLAGGDERDYADTLLTLAARIARPARAASAVGLVGRPSPGLSGRVTHLLEKDRDMSTTLTARSRKLISVIAAGVMIGLPLAAMRGPEPVRADDPLPATEPPESVDGAAADDAAATFALLAGENAVAAAVNRSIVRLEANVDGDERIGSGVVISTGEVSREHGFQQLLTAAHLMKDFDSQRDTLHIQFFDEPEPRKWSPAYLDVDEESGLAVLCFEDPELEEAAATFGSLRRMPEIDDAVTFHVWHDGEAAEFRRQHVVAVDRYTGPSNLECDGLPQDGDSAGGLFNARGELVGILVGADPDARRGLYHTLPAIFEFLGIDEPETADLADGGEYGVPVTGSPIGLPGPPHLPLGSPAGLQSASTPAAVVATANAGDVEVILIALGADDDGALAEVHFLTESLGTGDEAVEELSSRLEDAADVASGEERELQVQISVAPRLNYQSVVEIINICKAHGVQNVGMAVLMLSPDEDFVISIGFVRNSEGRRLSETPVVFWEDRVHGAGDLADVFETERQRQPGTDVTLVLRADSDVAAGVVQDVIREAQAAGFVKFALRVLEADPEQPVLEGVILDVLERDEEGYVKFSIGSDDGLRLQDQLDVYRATATTADREFVGRIEVSFLYPDEAVGRVLQSLVEKPIETGDHVFCPLRVEPGNEQPAAPSIDVSSALQLQRLQNQVLRSILESQNLWSQGRRDESRQLLDDTLDELQRSDIDLEEIAPLLSAVQEARGDSAQLVLNGLVVEVATRDQGNLVHISIGSDDGLKMNQQLDVYRGDRAEDRKHVGRIEIIHLMPDQAVARVIQSWTANPIENGDTVIGPLSADAPYPDLSRVVSDADEYVGPLVQLHLRQPSETNWHWTDPESDETTVLVAPCRVNVTPGTLILKVTGLPGKEGLGLRATMEIPVPNPAAGTFIDHNALPIDLTEEDLSQAESGNHVVKVIYLPDPEFQELAIAGVETLVTTRLDPGTDPIAEADRRGTILAVIRVGNRSAGGSEN